MSPRRSRVEMGMCRITTQMRRAIWLYSSSAESRDNDSRRRPLDLKKVAASTEAAWNLTIQTPPIQMGARQVQTRRMGTDRMRTARMMKVRAARALRLADRMAVAGPMETTLRMAARLKATTRRVMTVSRMTERPTRAQARMMIAVIPLKEVRAKRASSRRGQETIQARRKWMQTLAGKTIALFLKWSADESPLFRIFGLALDGA
mmetsp:Transcript_18053/g.50287  ORF Transcript_18053/g.50287 Transcript_18053/m.50287 type:complete len:205 (+) Transcript_18053:316-930(+)